MATHIFENVAERPLVGNSIKEESAIVASVLAGIVMGFFVMFRLWEAKLVDVKYLPYLMLTNWTHFLIATYFICAAFIPAGNAMNLIGITLAILGTFVFVGRSLYLKYELGSFMTTFKDLVSHWIVPFCIIGWVLSGRAPVKPGDSKWKWIVGLGFLGIVLVWFVFNIAIAQIRNGSWVYNEASNPLTSDGRWHMVILGCIAALCVLFILWAASKHTK